MKSFKNIYTPDALLSAVTETMRSQNISGFGFALLVETDGIGGADISIYLSSEWNALSEGARLDACCYGFTEIKNLSALESYCIDQL